MFQPFFGLVSVLTLTYVVLDHRLFSLVNCGLDIELKSDLKSALKTFCSILSDLSLSCGCIDSDLS